MKLSHKLAFLLFFGILIPSTIMTYINYNATVKIITSIVQEDLHNSVDQRINYVENYSEHLLSSLEIISKKKRLHSAYKNLQQEIEQGTEYYQCKFSASLCRIHFLNFDYLVLS